MNNQRPVSRYGRYPHDGVCCVLSSVYFWSAGTVPPFAGVGGVLYERIVVDQARRVADLFLRRTRRLQCAFVSIVGCVSSKVVCPLPT